MSYYGRGVYHASNLVIWQLRVVPGPQHLLFMTWGRRVHQERGLIALVVIFMLFLVKKVSRIVEDHFFRDVFVLCSSTQTSI
jgi:hypothetical protein